MAGLRKVDLARRLASYLEASGFEVRDALWEGGAVGKLPFRLIVGAAGSQHEYRCYVWTITHGGKHRSDDEYRIQTLLGGDRRRLDFGEVTTLLLGLYVARLDPMSDSLGRALPDPEAEIVVAWDPTVHVQLGWSSSCQVSFDQIEMAFLRGTAIESRAVAMGQIEQILAMRPEFFSRYLQTAVEGHNSRVWLGLEGSGRTDH